MSVTIDCGEGRHDVCSGSGTQPYLIPQEAGEEFKCACGCHGAVAAQPEGAERWTLDICPEHGAVGDFAEPERQKYCPECEEPTEAVPVVPEALLHKERAQRKRATENRDRWGQHAKHYRDRALQAEAEAEQLKAERDAAENLYDLIQQSHLDTIARAEAAEQRIESLERAQAELVAAIQAVQDRYGIPNVGGEWERLYAAKDAALDTTQAEQRQAAFPHEERMQAVDEALDRQEVDGG